MVDRRTSPRKRDYTEHASSDAPTPSSQGGGEGREPSQPPSSPPAIPFDQDDEDLYLAVEAEVPLDDLDDAVEEEEGEDLFGDNMEQDYRASEVLDRYNLNADEIDDEAYGAMDIADRQEVDALLDRRDRRELLGKSSHGSSRRHGAFLSEDDEEGATSDAAALPLRRRRRHDYEEDDLDEDVADEDGNLAAPLLSLESLTDVKTDTVAEWVVQPAVSRSIARGFKNFLLTCMDEDGWSIYGRRIETLGEENSESLVIEYKHLMDSKAVLAYFLVVAPTEVLSIFDKVTMEAIELVYPNYKHIHQEVHVRVSGLPTVFTLRQLREQHLNTLVRVTGVVTRRTGVFPQLKYIKFDCPKCGQILGPYVQYSSQEVRISFCHNCQSRGPFILNSEKTLYRNYQRITLQESPGTVPAGRLPRHREVILLCDLIDQVKPGDEIDLTGIYRNTYDGVLNAKNGFPVFATVIDANLVRRREVAYAGDIYHLSRVEEREIRQLANDPKIIEKIIDSCAPSIYGHRDIKVAVACSLFGGVPKVSGKLSLRGDINVLLLGDPGTAKSQILKWVESVANRAVFATGQGASAVGLTASVRKDPITREWTLEGGALVLADKGICLIDEFDKMNDQDRTSIHEAMEQQSISISKAGIVTTLQARCAVVAAANPNGGRYNATLPFSQNVDLTEPILSRFDVLCVVRDLVDPEADEELAEFVVNSHDRAHPLNRDKIRDTAEEQPHGPIPQDVLRKYIHYARTNTKPQLLNLDQERIASLYSHLRRESLATGSFPITVRHLESIIRLSESFARMRLSEYVSKSDVDRAVKVAINSFVGAQKISVRRTLAKSFVKYTHF